MYFQGNQISQNIQHCKHSTRPSFDSENTGAISQSLWEIDLIIHWWLMSPLAFGAVRRSYKNLKVRKLQGNFNFCSHIDILKVIKKHLLKIASLLLTLLPSPICILLFPLKCFKILPHLTVFALHIPFAYNYLHLTFQMSGSSHSEFSSASLAQWALFPSLLL